MKAIQPVLDDSRKKPFYLQLYDYIRQAILTGEIESGEKLPSLRSLAKSTGLSMTTVEKAYDQLLVEGYIYSRAQSGFYAGDLQPSHVEAISGEAETVPFKTPDSYLSVPRMNYDPECFDFNKWKKCMNRVLTENSPTLFFEGDPQGEIQLRLQIAQYLYMSRGVSCGPEQIFIGAGTQQITNYLATVLRSLSIEHVALESPGYRPVRNTFHDRGFAITDVDVSREGLILEKLPTNIRTAAYVSPSNNSLTGAVMPVGRRYELLNWAAANDSYIIEDDYDSELRYFGRPVPPIKGLENNQRVIYLGSFSSTLFAAVKISYLVLPESMARQFRQVIRGYSQTCSKLEQLTLALFMETGFYQTHIKKVRKLYAQKLDLVTEVFRDKASAFVELASTSSGTNLILRVHSKKTPEQLKKDAEEIGVPVTVPDTGNTIALYYNQIPLEKIPDVIDRLIGIWRSR